MAFLSAYATYNELNEARQNIWLRRVLFTPP